MCILQDHSEEEFVDNWSKCQSVLSDIKIVMNVFERCSADCHSQEFQLSSLKSRPIPPRAFLAQEAKQLKLKAQVPLLNLRSGLTLIPWMRVFLEGSHETGR